MAYDFASSSVQSMSATPAPATAVPLTLACWFRRQSTFSGNPALVAIGRNIIDGAVLLISIRSGTNVIGAGVFDGSGTYHQSVSGSGTAANTWQHACGVFTANNSRTAYLNAVAGTTNTNTVTAASINTVGIGGVIRPTVLDPHNGNIAEVGIWDVALNAAEIASLAKGMTCDKVRPQNLKFYAPLVRDLVDVEGGLTITNNNSATVANHPRVYA